MSTGAVLVEHGRRSLLIDAGWGHFVGEMEFGSVQCGDLLAQLALAGKSSQDIDTVAFTHLHIDHVGWVFDATTDPPRPWFPRARHVVAGAELDASNCEATGTAAANLLIPLAERCEAVADGDEIFPHVFALATPGHSPGHTAYVVSSGGRRLIIFGDVFHSPAQFIHTACASAPDADTDLARMARRRLLAELRRPGTLGFGIHFADVPFGYLIEERIPHWLPVSGTVLA